jgi:O-antigen biosynthesis protein
MTLPMRLLVVHPEGNVTNNPHLYALVGSLVAAGVEVDLLIPDRPDLEAGTLVTGCTVVKAPVEPMSFHDHTLLLRGVGAAGATEAIRTFNDRRGRYNFILGVDRGIIEASLVARAQGAPHALLSYEIYFAAECGAEFKRPEVDACRGIAFAICQDSVRSAELCRENGIDPERLILMPTAGLGLKLVPRSAELQERLGLPAETRFLVYMGELGGSWSGVDRLIAAAAALPEGWAVILHHRYGEEVARRYLGPALTDAPPNVHLSPLGQLPPEELHRLLACCELGAAFYFPTYVDRSCGRNLQFVGLSSGKVATYLQHGLPVAVNEIGEMSDLVREYGAGIVVEDIAELAEALADLKRRSLPEMRAGARRLFEEKLDLTRGIPRLLAALGVEAESAARARESPRDPFGEEK